MAIYQALDIGFFTFHSLFIGFILSGWAWRRTRPAHLAAVALTIASWAGLGLYYGFGYCPCTDWHWQVRIELGHFDMPRSYLKFLLDEITGGDAPDRWVDAAAVGALTLVTLLSGTLYWRDRKRSALQPPSTIESQN
jgi:hypothetical protein